MPKKWDHVARFASTVEVQMDVVVLMDIVAAVVSELAEPGSIAIDQISHSISQISMNHV